MAIDKAQKRTNFKRLARIRTDAVLDRLRIIGNLSNRSMYDYTDEEINKIFTAIEEQTRLVKAKFKKPRRKFTF